MPLFNPPAAAAGGSTAALATYADLFTDTITSGLTIAIVGSTLTLTTAAGVAYIGGARVSYPATPKTYGANLDTYVFANNAAGFTYLTVANFAAAPATPANTQPVALVSMGLTSLSGLTDLRSLSVTLVGQLTINGDGSIVTAGIGGAGSVAGVARGSTATDLQSSRTANAQVASGVNSAVLSGSSNTASGLNAVVASGNANTASGQFSSVLGGVNALANKYGQQAQSSGRFNVNGDAQFGSYLLRALTGTATTSPMYLDQTGAKLTLVLKQAMTFRIQLVAVTAGAADSAAWTITGLITRTATTTALIGTPTVTKISSSTNATAWAAAVTADTVNFALNINVTGAASVSIQWVASVHTTETIF